MAGTVLIVLHGVIHVTLVFDDTLQNRTTHATQRPSTASHRCWCCTCFRISARRRLAALRRRHSSAISTTGYTKTSAMMMSHMIKPSLVDRSRKYRASVSGRLREAMKMASSEPNIVSWLRMNEIASRNREQHPDDDGRDQRNPAPISGPFAARSSDRTRPAPRNTTMVWSFDLTLSCRKPARENPCDGSHLRPPKLGPKGEAGLATVIQPARSTCESGHTTRKLRRNVYGKPSPGGDVATASTLRIARFSSKPHGRGPARA
jgi:hypothetical protein